MKCSINLYLYSTFHIYIFIIINKVHIWDRHLWRNKNKNRSEKSRVCDLLGKNCCTVHLFFLHFLKVHIYFLCNIFVVVVGVWLGFSNKNE